MAGSARSEGDGVAMFRFSCHMLITTVFVCLIACASDRLVVAEVPMPNETLEIEATRIFRPRGDFVGSGRFSLVPEKPWLALWYRMPGGEHSVNAILDYEADKEVFSYVPQQNATFDRAPIVSFGAKLIAYPINGARVGLNQIPSGKSYFKSLVGHRDCVPLIAFHPDGKRAVTVGRDASVVIWDLLAPEEEDVIAEFDGHEQPDGAIPTCCLALSPDGRLALTGDVDGCAILWEVDTQRTLHRFPRLVSEFYKPTKKQGESLGVVLTGPNLKPVEIFENADDQGDEIAAAAFFADGSKVVVAGREMGVHVFDTRSGQKLAEHVAKFGWLRKIGPVLSNDIPVLARGQFKATDGGPWVTDVAVSPDGKYILLASDPYPKLWEWQADRLWLLKGHHRADPNRIPEMARGLPVPRTDPGGVKSLAFTHNGKFAITGGEDGTIRFWAIADLGVR